MIEYYYIEQVRNDDIPQVITDELIEGSDSCTEYLEAVPCFLVDNSGDGLDYFGTFNLLFRRKA